MCSKVEEREPSCVDLTRAPCQKKSLHQPDASEVVQVLCGGLKKNFSHVNVEIVECPDLTQPPFTLVCKGLGGSPQIFDVGGPPYLLPLVNRQKVYNVPDICSLAGINPVYAIGPGAGPWPSIGTNCEGIVNLSVVDGVVEQQSRVASVEPYGAAKGQGGCKLEVLPPDEHRCALMANLFICKGSVDKVLKVECIKRIGSDDFISSIRKTLQAHYKDKPVGLGGTFLLKEGKSKEHIMPDFSSTPLTNDQEVDTWLHYFDMSAPLINVGTLMSHDPDMDLRVQHFHTFSHHNEGGHYHIDTTPETASYLGYFAIAESITRVDAPVSTHKIGRD